MIPEDELKALQEDYRQMDCLFHWIHAGSYSPMERAHFIESMLLLRAIKQQNELIIKIFGIAQPQRDTYATEQAPLDSLLS